MKQKPSNPIPAPTTTPHIAYVGIDWADQKHDLCLFDPATQQFECSVIGSKPETIADWVESLRNDFQLGRLPSAPGKTWPIDLRALPIRLFSHSSSQDFTDYRSFCNLSGDKALRMNKLWFEGAKKAVSDCIVPPIPSSAHTTAQPRSVECCLVITTGILTAPI